MTRLRNPNTRNLKAGLIADLVSSGPAAEKYLFRKLTNVAVSSGLLSSAEQKESQKPNTLRILTYHRLGHPKMHTDRFDPTLLSANPDAFEKQMRFLKRNYNIVSLDQILSSLSSRHLLPPRAVMITFDDGYRDFLKTAWRCLVKLQIPCLLFVVTRYLDGDEKLFWWDELYQAVTTTERQVLRIPGLGTWHLQGVERRKDAVMDIAARLRRMDHHQAMNLHRLILDDSGVSPTARHSLLSWKDLRSMMADGLYVSGHSCTHPILSRLPTDQARTEITGCQEDLERELGQTWPVFAYPVGRQSDFNDKIISILREEGFKAAMTMIPGHNSLGHTSPLRLKRIGVFPHWSMDEFRLALTGVYRAYRMVLGSVPEWMRV